MSETIKQSVLNKSRKDKFMLTLNTPKCLLNISSKDQRAIMQKSHLRVIPSSLQYSVFGAVVPAISIPSIDLPQWGQTLKASSHNRPAYDDMTVSFTIDNEFNNYWYIWKWLDILNDSETSAYDERRIGTSKSIAEYLNNRDIDNPGIMLDYQTNLTLTGLNEYNKEVVSFIYTNAYPTTLGEITYSYRDEAEIDSSVTFSFTQLHVNLL